MFKKIYEELVAIRKELQAIRGNLESSKFIPEDSDGLRDSRESNSIALHLANRE